MKIFVISMAGEFSEDGYSIVPKAFTSKEEADKYVKFLEDKYDSMDIYGADKEEFLKLFGTDHGRMGRRFFVDEITLESK